MGYSDLAIFGSPNVSTPHIDDLVRRGTKFTQWVSAAPICTPSRAALQTGRYPIRTGCIGNVEARRVVPMPSSPGGLDPAQHMSIATALKKAGYATGMSGKWHLGISGNKHHEEQDFRFHPSSHGYDTYLGAPWTNAPMCAMDSDGISQKFSTGPSFCFLTANRTVVQQPLRLENFTATITSHALQFFDARAAEVQASEVAGTTPRPWFFFMSYFHVHTPLFTNRSNRGRSKGGEFGDNVEELDDSVGEIVQALQHRGFEKNTLIFLTSDNGPYQEEGWEKSGRTNIYDEETGRHLGRLKGGKGQLFEGGVRMPGAVVWPAVVQPATTSDVLVSTLDIFPTVLTAAGIKLGDDYPVDGRDMGPVLRRHSTASQHDVFLHYCGFSVVAARVAGRFKVFWATPKWYTHNKEDNAVCQQCCNGVNPLSRLTGATATQLCGCEAKDLDHHDPPLVFDMTYDKFELTPLTARAWPSDAGLGLLDVVRKATAARQVMEASVHPKPDKSGAGTCTAGMPSSARQPCCPGCHSTVGLIFPSCKHHLLGGCTCNDVPVGSSISSSSGSNNSHDSSNRHANVLRWTSDTAVVV